jgi:hypothetical protein
MSASNPTTLSLNPKLNAKLNRKLATQSLLFAGLSGATVLVLRIIEELWNNSGGTFK